MLSLCAACEPESCCLSSPAVGSIIFSSPVLSEVSVVSISPSSETRRARRRSSVTLTLCCDELDVLSVVMTWSVVMMWSGAGVRV